MIYLAFTREDGTTAGAHIPDEQGPAFRSAITELRNELGERAAGAHAYHREDAIVRAIAALGTFAGALNAVIPAGDPDYDKETN